MDFILEDDPSAPKDERLPDGLDADSQLFSQQILIQIVLARPYFSRIWVIQELPLADRSE